MTNANNTQKLRTVALCFGGGGLDEGLARVLPNATLSLIVEIEAYAVAIALGRMEVGDLPAVPIWTDLKTLRWDEVAGTFDVLTGGFPCQPFSAAGKRQGSDDPRHLWPYIVRGIETCKPKLCVFENVSGILSAKLGAGHGDPEGTPVALHVLRSLERLGYRATFAVSQADEAGHRHTRQRVFFVAVRKDVDVRELGYAQRDGLDATEVTRGSAKSNGESRMCEHKGSGVSSGFVHGELSDTNCTGLQTQGTEQQTAGTPGSNTELADSGCKHGQSGHAIGIQKDQTERTPCVPDDQSGCDRQLADSDSLWEPQSEGCVKNVSGRNSDSGFQLPDADSQRLQGCECSRGTNASGREVPHGHPSKCSNPSITERVLGKGYLQWGWEFPRTYSDPEEAIKSLMGDAAHGLDPEHVRTHREDMLRMLGNGVVPDTAEIAIRLCLEELFNPMSDVH